MLCISLLRSRNLRIAQPLLFSMCLSPRLTFLANLKLNPLDVMKTDKLIVLHAIIYIISFVQISEPTYVLSGLHMFLIPIIVLKSGWIKTDKMNNRKKILRSEVWIDSFSEMSQHEILPLLYKHPLSLVMWWAHLAWKNVSECKQISLADSRALCLYILDIPVRFSNVILIRL